MFADDIWNTLALSLKIASLSVVLSLPFALRLAWVLSRQRFRGCSLLEGLLILPLLLPPVVTGYGLLLLFGRSGLFGQALSPWGLHVAFHWTGAVIAAAVMGFPLLVLSLRLAFDNVDRHLEQAAETLGAGAWRRFFTLTLPLSFRGLVAGMVLAFARAFGEFGATMTFVANIPGETRTVPMAIYELLNTPHAEAEMHALIAITFCVAITALASVTLIMRYHSTHRVLHD